MVTKTKSFPDLEGKICVVTGGAGVLGGAIARALAGEGVRVALLDVDRDAARHRAEEVRAETAASCLALGADVCDEASLRDAHRELQAEMGPADILVNAAGGNAEGATTGTDILKGGGPGADAPGQLHDSFFGLDFEAIQSTFSLNFIGTLLPTMVFARDMGGSRGGAILNISSMAALRPLTRVPAYSAAKAAVENFTRWLAVHLAGAAIRVNAIAPGFFLTAQNRFLLYEPSGSHLTARGEKILAATPMGRFGDPEDLAGTALWLLSDLSRFVTGVVVPVDGGFSAFSGV